MSEVLDTLPATAAEIREATGLGHEELYACLVRLEGEGRARIDTANYSRQAVVWECVSPTRRGGLGLRKHA